MLEDILSAARERRQQESGRRCVGEVGMAGEGNDSTGGGEGIGELVLWGGYM